MRRLTVEERVHTHRQHLIYRLLPAERSPSIDGCRETCLVHHATYACDDTFVPRTLGWRHGHPDRLAQGCGSTKQLRGPIGLSIDPCDLCDSVETISRMTAIAECPQCR